MTADEKLKGASNQFVIGHRGGLVIVNNYGNEEVPPNWMAFTPDEARSLAKVLLDAADAAERTNERTTS